MNKNYITFSLGAVALLCIGIGIGSSVASCKNKIAVVDLVAVIGKSAQVQALKNDVTTKTQELTQWLQNAQNEVKSEKSKEKQEALLQQYNAQFAQKRELISQDYNKKLKIVDNDINNTIVKIAKEKGYKSVISKSVVVYSDADITEDVLKVIK